MLRTLRTLTAALAVAAASGAAPPAAGSSDTADVTLARAALAAVDADPQLRAVVVSVKDRVAVVLGPVPSAAAVRRAEEVVRAVPGVSEVRNGCYVRAGTDPLIRPVQDWPSALPPRRMPDLSGLVLPPKVDAEGESLPPALAQAPAERKSESLKPPAPADGLLLPPVVPGSGPTPAPATPIAPGVLTGRPGGPMEAAEAARRADPRFAGLTVVPKDGGLVVEGTARQAADAWDLARNLRNVPGAGWVAVGRVTVK